jgi:hypothetical protein
MRGKESRHCQMDEAYVRLLFAQRRNEVFAILITIHSDRQRMETYLEDIYIAQEKWKSDMTRMFLRCV